MDGENPNNKKIHNHGLRLVKGHAGESNTSSNSKDGTTTTKAKKNPLIVQLSALADAIDADVNMLLKL
jgi:hypothetical protein